MHLLKLKSRFCQKFLHEITLTAQSKENSSLNSPCSCSLHLSQENHFFLHVRNSSSSSERTILSKESPVVVELQNLQLGHMVAHYPHLEGSVNIHFALSHLDFIHVANLLKILKPHPAQLFSRRSRLLCTSLSSDLPRL